MLVGDVDQLPSVGPGQVLADIIASACGAGRALDRGLPPGRREPDHCQRPSDQPRADADLARARVATSILSMRRTRKTGCGKLLAVVRERIPKRFGFDPIRDIQVLCPMNRGGLGARSLNIELQKVLNPPGDIRIERFGWTFCPGDKVMQVENDYDKDVYNGDLGIVSPSISRKANSSPSSTAAKSPTALANWMNWCSPMRRRSTKARARNTRP